MSNQADTGQMSKLLDEWAEIALSLGWVKEWVNGAILPREMVFFLARCEEYGITSIIESGRQDGYSTKILGEFGRRKGVRVYSIDYEADATRAQNCRARLAMYPELKLLKGDANIVLGRLVRANDNGPLAILVDGPKGFWAMSLMFACAASEWVKLIALHNLVQDENKREFFESRADEPVFYECYPGIPGGFWEKLGAAEIEFISTVRGVRLLEYSSLGVMHVSNVVRQRLVSSFDPRFRLYQPPLVRWGWRLGLYWPTKYLYDFSHRFLK